MINWLCLVIDEKIGNLPARKSPTMRQLCLGIVFAMLALRNSVTCQNGSAYNAVLSTDGLPLCAVGSPANRTYCVASAIRCAASCKTFNGCTRFNYYQSGNGSCNTCSLFSYTPKLLDTVVGCKHSVVRWKVTVLDKFVDVLLNSHDRGLL
jgi:hypothetical protein